MRIGIDAGGTFTDFIVARDDGRLETFKLRSNPANPAALIVEGLRKAAGNERVEVVHGSTVATNALLERKGARTAFITTAGFEDLLHIARQNRSELYNLTPFPRYPLVPRELCFGVNERCYFDGTVARRPIAKELLRLKKRLRREKVEAVAICFLHAYRTPDNERVAEDALRGDVFHCASHDICPEFREYERASTTVINAYVGPLMEQYLGELERLWNRPIFIMQSNGGFISTTEARRHPVRTVLSGPAGGVVGTFEIARQSGFSRTLGFDMGGTSTDVSLCDGAPRETSEASIDGFPVRVSMLDIHTVGAGGGSIARMDEGGLLRVGPESAGADPGPACYGKGELPTVTDAHVVLGRIAEDQLVGGEMHIDSHRAEHAIARIAKALHLDIPGAAAGILRVANANMEHAIRLVSVERGHDPRDFALVAFGGCGGLHACDLAEELGIRTVLVPEHAGVLSALGMLLADNVRDYAAGVLGRSENIEREFRKLEATARKDARDSVLTRSADLRYAGQSYELNVPWGPNKPGEAFHRDHQRQYGYSDVKRAVEVVTIRVKSRIAAPPLNLQGRRCKPTQAATRRIFVSSEWRETPVYQRDAILARDRKGPALVIDYGSTTLIPLGWRFRLDGCGTLVVRR